MGFDNSGGFAPQSQFANNQGQGSFGNNQMNTQMASYGKGGGGCFGGKSGGKSGDSGGGSSAPLACPVVKFGAIYVESSPWVCKKIFTLNTSGLLKQPVSMETCVGILSVIPEG